MEKNLKNISGITLVALVITIVILIILAGISVAGLTNSGILEKAEKAKKESNYESNFEKVKLKLYEAQIQCISDNLEVNLKTIAKKLNNDDEVEYEYLLFDKQTENNQEDYEQLEVNEADSRIDDAKFILLKLLNIDDVYVIDSKYQVNVKNANIEARAKVNTKLEHSKLTNTTAYRNKKYTTEIEIDKGEVIDEVVVKMNGKDITSTSVKGNSINIEKVEENIEITVSTAWDGTTISTKLDGMGTQEKPYEINTGADFVYAAQQINDGSSSKINAGDDAMAYNAYYELKNNIKLNKTSNIQSSENLNNWSPIGTKEKPFQGTFDGNYKEIQNLYINSTSAQQGLFGFIKDATIKKIIINDKSIITTTQGSVGAIAGRADGETTIDSCGNYGTVTGNNTVGGICGSASSNNVKIEKCFNKGVITAIKYACGGIIGDNYTSLKYCYSTNKVSAKGETGAGYTNVGGICGYNSGYVENSYTVSTIYGYSGYGRGMVVGQQFSGAYTKKSYSLNNQNYSIIGYKKGGSSSECGKFSDETIKSWDQATIEQKLGDVFCNDEEESEKTNIDGSTTVEYKYNSGYPILKWEKEK